MPFPEHEIAEYRALYKKVYDEEISEGQAIEDYTRLRYLYWILAHRPPKDAPTPYDPPLPPWL